MEKRKNYEQKMKENYQQKKQDEELLLIEEKRKEKEYQKHKNTTKKNALVFKNQKNEYEKKLALWQKVKFQLKRIISTIF